MRFLEARFLKNTAIVATGTLAIALSVSTMNAQDKAAEKAEPKADAAAAETHCGPAGNHALLERMTAAFGLSCEQKFQIEPYLHDEESVSKPLLAFGAFTPEEKKDFMLKIKLAARNQIKPMLTPEQQKKMDEDIDTVASKGGGSKGGDGEAKKGGSKNPKKPVKIAEPFAGEEALCEALNKYSALSADQKKEMILQVKKAARRDGAPELTAEQQQKIDADIQQLTAPATKGK
jgi:uncharacterized protein YoaH (UPF0181 family)